MRSKPPRRGCGGGGSPAMREFRSCAQGHGWAGHGIGSRSSDIPRARLDNRHLVVRLRSWGSVARSPFPRHRQTAYPMTDREKNRFSARAARYARVGANVGGVAAKIAATRFFGLTL